MTDKTNNLSVSIKALKAECRKRGIHGFSKKSKAELVQILSEDSPDDETFQKMQYYIKNVKQLKELCKQHKIKGYSNKSKHEIVDQIYARVKLNEKYGAEIEAAKKEGDNRLSINSIIIDYYEYAEKLGYNTTIIECYRNFVDNHAKFSKSLNKFLIKKCLRQKYLEKTQAEKAAKESNPAPTPKKPKGNKKNKNKSKK